MSLRRRQTKSHRLAPPRQALSTPDSVSLGEDSEPLIY